MIAVLATSITALGIYRLGVFFFAHWFGVAALIVIVLGIMAAHFKIPQKGWTQLHLTCMLLSLYILIGGGVNEVFLRVAILRRLVRNFDSPIIGKTHFAVVAVFAVLILTAHKEPFPDGPCDFRELMSDRSPRCDARAIGKILKALDI